MGKACLEYSLTLITPPSENILDSPLWPGVFYNRQ